MSYSCSDLASTVAELLASKGYRIHNGDAHTGVTVEDESGEDWWFTWSAPRMADCESGDTCVSSLGAEADALSHYFMHAEIPVAVSDEEDEALLTRLAVPLLERCASFIAGFEGDAMQEGVAALLGDIRAALDDQSGNLLQADVAPIEEHQASAVPTVCVVMDGCLIQGIYSDAAVRTVIVDYDVEGTTDDLTSVPQGDGTSAAAIVHVCDADQDAATVYRMLALAAGDQSIDDDTGVPIVRPVYIIRGANAYWLEPIAAGYVAKALISAPLRAADMAVVWDDETEVNPPECEGYASIVAALQAG